MKMWALVYWVVSLNLGFTGQLYFEDRALCEKARDIVVRGSLKGVCVMVKRGADGQEMERKEDESR
jgi:hypothetical protein